MAKADVRWKQRFSNYQKAYQQLTQAVEVNQPDQLQKQGIIQCFEYTFELAWKTLQDYLADQKGYVDIKGPKPVLEQAFADGIVHDGVQWMDMLKSRNLTSHLYDEQTVELIYQKIVQDYFDLFRTLHDYFNQAL